MMASAAVLVAQYFPCEVDDWEGIPAVDRTWRAWKVAFRLAHLNRQRQLQASGGGEPLRGAHSVVPAPAATIDRLGTALNNLALAAAKDTTILQQLMTANLALTTSNATLTAANKKLSEALAKRSAPAETPGTPGAHRPATTVGRMGIDAARTTRVQSVAPRPQVTRSRRWLPTRWEGARRTRDGTHVAPDGVGWRI